MTNTIFIVEFDAIPVAFTAASFDFGAVLNRLNGTFSGQ
jgi:hypothetical protein